MTAFQRLATPVFRADQFDPSPFRCGRLGTTLALAVLVMGGGCTGESESTAPQAEILTNSAVDDVPIADSTHETETITATIDESGRKWLTPDVPYDVFAGLPSEEEIAAVASQDVTKPNRTAADVEGTPLASTEAPIVRPAAPDSDSRSDAPQSAPTAGWETVLPREALHSEIAAIRNELGEQLLTVGSYNATFEQVAIDAWVMSALSTIAAEHSGPISWKKNALLARDASAALAMAATGRGRENFNEAQLANQQLVAVLNNNRPADLGSPDETRSREETADRAALMSRMQAAFDRLKAEAGDEPSFRKSSGIAAREARVLAALAKFTSHADYGSADEPEYQTAAGKVVSAGRDMSEAAAAMDFASFQAAFDRVGTACAQCHQQYRFGL